MDLTELLLVAAKESSERKHAELQAMERFNQQTAIESAWSQLQDSDFGELQPLVIALKGSPSARERLKQLHDNTRATFDERRDVVAGLTAAACIAVLEKNEVALRKIAAMRTSDSQAALSSLGTALFAATIPPRPEPQRVRTWPEARAAIEQLIDRGLPKATNRELAKLLRCSESLIRKATKTSAKCQDWKPREVPAIDSKNVERLTDQTLENLAAREQPAIPTDEVEHALKEILAAASTQEKDCILAMDNNHRMDLARAYLEQFADQQAGNRIAGRRV